MADDTHVTYWLSGAAHDLDAAEALFAAGKYDWCLFIGHLVLEKTLKAYFSLKTAFAEIKRFYAWLLSLMK